MAFLDSGLQRTVYGGAIDSGPGNVMSVWHYITNDTAGNIQADLYFDTTAMKLGDLLFASTDTDGNPSVNIYVVTIGTGDPDNNDVTISSI